MPRCTGETARELRGDLPGRDDRDRRSSSTRRAVERLAEELAAVRDGGGRLFILGVGGSAGHASHAVNDFRKLCGFEAYAPTDNVSELTARTNDEGWDTTFRELAPGVAPGAPTMRVLVFSVGGGDAERSISVNLVRALETAQERRRGGLRHRRPRRRLHGARSPTRPSSIPAAVRRARHPAHRRAVRGGLAPARQPSRRCRRSRTKWESLRDRQ